MSRYKTELVYGLHSVRHALVNKPYKILEVWLQNGCEGKMVREIQTFAKSARLPIQIVHKSTLDRLTHNGHHQGAMLRRRLSKAKGQIDWQDYLQGLTKEVLRILVIDGVQDPHNLGACLRVADAAGVHAVLVSNRHSVGLTESVRRVASGAADTVKIYYVNHLTTVLDTLRKMNIWILGITGEGRLSLYSCDLNRSIAFIVGTEGSGIRMQVKKHCDELVNIPMKGQIESLNLAVATGVCLYEGLRQSLL